MNRIISILKGVNLQTFEDCKIFLFKSSQKNDYESTMFSFTIFVIIMTQFFHLIKYIIQIKIVCLDFGFMADLSVYNFFSRLITRYKYH